MHQVSPAPSRTTSRRTGTRRRMHDDRRRTLSTRMGRTARRPRHDALGRLLRVASRVCRARRVARAGRAARRRPRGPRVPRRRAPRERATARRAGRCAMADRGPTALTCGRSRGTRTRAGRSDDVENVYLSEYEQLRRDPDSELPESLRGLGLPNLYGGRPRYGRESRVYRYAWAVPDDAALRIMAKHAPIVEIGAGTGYWAALLRARGVDIVAYDKDPPDGGEGHPFHAARRAWTDVAVGGPEKAAEHPDRTLFLCWPPYDDPLAADCLRGYRR